jgi:hypothetical protein
MNIIRPIAIYLPQYHTIPENDKAWGKGFTEWTNVKKAKPLFEGHYQPHVPHEDVGYYDLSNPEVLIRQAAMAKEFGIHGFAYYHYWFNGKRLLETPLDNMLKTGTPDFPFLYIWANENWSKRYDGQDDQIIINQEHSIEDDIEHIRFLCKNVFSDKRYITIDEKPVFLVYRTDLLPDSNETARIWRQEAKNFGFKDLYLIRVENFENGVDPSDIGFDAAMEFAPDWSCIDNYKSKPDLAPNNYVHDYSTTVLNMALKPKPNYLMYRCVFPGWDNSPRKSKNAIIFEKKSIFAFKYLYLNMLDYTNKYLPNNAKFIFINAWNEWGEGCHIEPDKENGFAFLEIIKEGANNRSMEFLTECIHFLELNLISRKKIFEKYDSLQYEYNKIVKNKSYRILNFLHNKYKGLNKIFR